MTSEDLKYLKRKVTGGSLDVHPTEKSLIVQYEIEAVILGESGQPVLGEKKHRTKTIRLQALDEKTDIKVMALDILDKCKLIQPSKIHQVEQLLYYLQNRKSTPVPINSANGNKKKLTSSANSRPEEPGFGNSFENGNGEMANINDIEMYLEMLYDEVAEKIRSSSLILQLARNPDNLSELYENEILVGALARTLNEEWKQSTELATNIVYIFFCFSSFTQFHGVVSHFQVGSLCLKIIEYELEKYIQWKNQISKMTISASNKIKDNGTAGENNKSIQSNKELLKVTKQFNLMVKKQEQLMRVAIYLLLNLSEDIKLEVKMKNKGIITMLTSCLERDNPELLILVVSFLKKLSIFAENILEMAKYGVVPKISTILSLNHQSKKGREDLTNVCLRLLLNLSFDSTLRTHMVDLRSTTGSNHPVLLPILVQMLRDDSTVLLALCVLYHISVDQKNRSSLAWIDCIGVLMKKILSDIPTSLTSKESPGLEITAILINLAAESHCAENIASGKNIQILMKRAIKKRDPLLLKILRNVSKHGEDDVNENANGERFSENVGGPNKKIAGSNENGTGRSVNLKPLFIDYIADIGAVLQERLLLGKDGLKKEGKDGSKEYDNDYEFVVECVGLLANLTIPELDFEAILNEFSLIDWIAKNLATSNNNNNNNPSKTIPLTTGLATIAHKTNALSLELVRLLGTACSDDGCASLVTERNIVQALIGLLNERQEDDVMVLQIVYVFYKLTMHENTREVIVKKSQAPAYLIDLMHDKNADIRKICDATLDIILETDEIWAKKIKTEKFRWHNSQWLEMIQNRAFGQNNEFNVGDEEFDDNFLSADHPLAAFIQDSDILDRPDLFYDFGIGNENEFSTTIDPSSFGYSHLGISGSSGNFPSEYNNTASFTGQQQRNKFLNSHPFSAAADPYPRPDTSFGHRLSEMGFSGNAEYLFN